MKGAKKAISTRFNRVLICPALAFGGKKMNANIASLHSLSPGHDLDAYVQTVNAMPVLTPEAERELAEKFYFENDLHAEKRVGSWALAVCRSLSSDLSRLWIA
ncbi:MAG: hypothetical protein Ct9H300mP27_09600 [Chloroflexota bacterium]|nr:MAG: hypothetical protein Ct9H300mP27_09600 [Chloroflexota bacterium]